MHSLPPEGGEGGMGGGILGATKVGSDLQLTAAEASVVQLESFPPYFRRGEQSGREGGRSTTILHPVSWVNDGSGTRTRRDDKMLVDFHAKLERLSQVNTLQDTEMGQHDSNTQVSQFSVNSSLHMDV